MDKKGANEVNGVELQAMSTELDNDQKITPDRDSSSDHAEAEPSHSQFSHEGSTMEESSHNHIITTEINVINETKEDELDDSDYDTNCLSQIEYQRQETIVLNEQQTRRMQQFYSHKWFKLLTNDAFYGRVLILILSFLLFALSSAYCVAQFWSVKLDLVKKCDPLTREEIWKHSYESGLVDGNIVMSEESQYGHTKDSCWTTQHFDTNTDQLWYKNVYKAERSQHDFITKSVLFGCVSLYCFVIIVYNIITIIADIGYVRRHELHTKSKLYEQQHNNEDVEPTLKCKSCVCPLLKSKVGSLQRIWKQYFSNDTFAWFVRNGLSQIMEIIIQSNALLLYNGYSATDATALLANKPYLIQVFSVILALNCFGAGILWMSYGLIPSKCHGLLFELSLFLVDQSSDLFYTIFPFVMILTDKYNANTDDILVILGQLNINSTTAFVSAFFPLFLLCTQCLRLTNTTKTKLRDRYYKEWQFIVTVHDIQAHTKPRAAVTNQQQVGEKQAKTIVQDTITLQLKRMVTTRNWVTKSSASESTYSTIDINMYKNDTNNICCNCIQRMNMKQIILVIVSLFYIIYGVVVLILVNHYINNAHSYCNSVKESNYFMNGALINNLSARDISLLTTNPELFLWDNCLVQVLPFTRDERYKCQCKVVVIEWDALQSTAAQRKKYLQLNLTQSVILSSMLNQWYMLEKFRTAGTEASSGYNAGITITQSMFHSHMKAFEWRDASIYCIEHGISAWKQLEYLMFENSFIRNKIPDDFGDLVEMKYLSFKSSSLQSFPSSICKLAELQVLHLELEHSIESIPECVTDLLALNILIIDSCVSLAHIPMAVFHLPNLMLLSIFHGFLSSQSFTKSYNDTSLSINTQMECYLELNPICNDDDLHLLPKDLQHLIHSSCNYPCNTTIAEQRVNEQFCSPRLLGDGHCDSVCHFCILDHGDCAQLCFAQQLTNCTYDKLANDKCDDGCDNIYCSVFENNGFTHIYGYADLHHCDKQNVSVRINKTSSFNSKSCEESNSIYVTDEFKAQYAETGDLLTWRCREAFLGDGQCDDLCRTKECNYDANDCELGCIETCSHIYQAWNLFNSQEFDVYNVNISVACAEIWPKAVALTGADPSDCESKLHDRDFNHDMHINFREFVSLSYWLAGGWDLKGKQLNCSQCIGMQYYDVNYNAMDPDTTTNAPLNTCNR